MPEAFQFTDWLRRHPLTALLLVATLCADVAVSLVPGHIRSRVMAVSLVFSQIGLLAIWAGIADKQRFLRALVLIPAIWAGLWVIGERSDHDYWLLVTMLSIHAISIVIIIWLLQALVTKNRSELRFSIKHMLAVTTVVAFLTMAWTYAMPLHFETIVIIVNSVFLAIVALLTFTFIKGPKAYVVLMVVIVAVHVILNTVTGGPAMDDIAVPFFFVQSLVYAAWFGVVRHDRRW